MNWQEPILDLLRVLAFLGVYAVLFLLAKQLNDLLSPYKLIEELAVRDNPAIGLSLSGYLLATGLVFLGPLLGPSEDLVSDLVLVAGYATLGIVFLNLSRWTLDKLILNQFCNIEALVEKRNVGVGAVRFGVYIATGLIAAGSLNGEGGGVVTATAFFVLGQLSLLAFARVYDLTSRFHLQTEVEQGNTAAGVAFGGTLIALGIILGKAVSGDFVSWSSNLLTFVEVAVGGIIVLQVLRVLMDKLILTGHDLNDEIARDGNLAAGFLETSVAISFALVAAALL